MDNSVVVQNLLYKRRKFRRKDKECLGNYQIEIFCSVGNSCVCVCVWCFRREKDKLESSLEHWSSVLIQKPFCPSRDVWEYVEMFPLERVLLASSRTWVEAKDV